MNNSLYLGCFITEKRKRNSMSCTDLANAIEISTGYLNQIEHGVRSNPDPKLILKLPAVLKLTREESIQLFDLYAELSGQIPPDITEYISENKFIQQALRQAKDTHASKEDWEQFIMQLKK